jgi:dUTP pyrophosphatase
MENNEIENDGFLDKELGELNQIIQSANELVKQMGGSNPFNLLQQQYPELGQKPNPIQPQPMNLKPKTESTVILNCVNQSNNPTPKFANVGDSGFDLRANLDKPIIIKPMTMEPISTGLYFEIENGYEIQIRSRSGLAMRNMVMLFNLGENDVQINHGDRIAQGVVCPVIGSGKLTILEVDQLSETPRGEDGFGSTGIK